MSDTTVGPGGAPLPPYTTNPVAAASYPPGTPVYRNAGKATAAIATSAAASNVVGLTSHQSSANERVFTQFAGLLTLPTAEWDAVTDQSGGLTAGAYYFVSDADAGELTTTPPSGGAGHYVAPVGLAWSSTTMLILPQRSVVSAG